MWPNKMSKVMERKKKRVILIQENDCFPEKTKHMGEIFSDNNCRKSFEIES